MRSSRLVLAAGISLLAVTGCASGVRRGDVAYVERPVETIYNEATESLDRRRWDIAAQQFDEVQRQHGNQSGQQQQRPAPQARAGSRCCHRRQPSHA